MKGKKVKQVSQWAIGQASYLWLLESLEMLIKQIIHTHLKGNKVEGMVSKVWKKLTVFNFFVHEKAAFSIPMGLICGLDTISYDIFRGKPRTHGSSDTYRLGQNLLVLTGEQNRLDVSEEKLSMALCQMIE